MGEVVVCHFDILAQRRDVSYLRMTSYWTPSFWDCVRMDVGKLYTELALGY